MDINQILKTYKTIAVVGLSSKPDRPSHIVAKYLKTQGYKIIPVNPRETEVLGEKCFPDLASVNQPVEIVDIFRRSDEVEPIVDEAIKVGAKVIWMQEGIVNENAAQKAKQAGLEVVMDKCMLKEHRKAVIK